MNFREMVRKETGRTELVNLDDIRILYPHEDGCAIIWRSPVWVITRYVDDYATVAVDILLKRGTT